jgi:hypothetical protein
VPKPYVEGLDIAFLAVKYVAQDIACVGELGNDRSLGLARHGVGFYCFDFLNERHLTREQREKRRMWLFLRLRKF